MPSLRSVVGLRVIGDVAVRSVALVSVPVIVRTSGAEGYGQFALITAVAYFGLPLTTLSLGHALVTFRVPGEAEGAARARLRRATGVVLGVLGAVGLVAAAAGPLLEGNPQRPLWAPCWLLLAAVALEQLVLDHLRGTAALLRYSVLQMIIGIGTLVAIVLVTRLTPDIATLIVVLAGARLTFALLLLTALSRGPHAVAPPPVRQMLSFSIPLVLAGLGAWGIYMTGRITVAVFSGTEALGAYSAALAAAGVLTLVSNALGLPALPRMVAALQRAGPDGLAGEVRLFRQLTDYLLAPVALLLAPLLPSLLTLLGGRELRLDALAAGLIVAAVSLEQRNVPIQYALLAANRSGPVRDIWLKAGALNATASVLLVPWAGLRGAGAAQLLSMLYLVLASRRALRRTLTASWSDGRRSGSRLASSTCAAALAVVVVVVATAGLGPATTLATGTVVGLAVFAAALAVTGEFEHVSAVVRRAARPGADG